MKFVIAEADARKRLDVWVTDKIDRVSRAFIGKLSDQGKILVNGQVVKGGYKLRIGDKVEVDYDFAELDIIPDIDLPVLYEDADCLVINKPVGVLTHSKGAFNPEGTVATFIKDKLTDASDWQAAGEAMQTRAGIVHRLDRTTSGLIICAKHPAAQTWLQKQFAQRRTKKTYYAVVSGQPLPAEAIIDMPIERNPKQPKTFRVGEGGKAAQTQYKIIASNKDYSLLKLQPVTGRTHQLRVHLRQIGHPIVGDVLYGGPPAERLYLHAEQLELTLPNHQRQVFTAPRPAEFQAIIS